VTKRFDEKLRLTSIILKTLTKGPMNWTPLIKLILKGSTPWKAQSTLEWLVRKGYIERPERGIYIITEKGRRFLEIIPQNS
jgi:predicted transcriptional regulator